MGLRSWAALRPDFWVCLLNWASGLAQSLAWMCCVAIARVAPSPGLLQATMDNAGPYGQCRPLGRTVLSPKALASSKGASFDVSGGG